MPLPRSDQTFVDSLCYWLSTVAFVKDPIIGINCRYSADVSFPYPEWVSMLQFDYFDGDWVLTQKSVQVICSYSKNLVVLDMPQLNCAVEKLKAFPNLQKLLVAGLYSSNLEYVRSSLKFSNIERVVICSPEKCDFEPLPDIICTCFPFLLYFGFYGNSYAAENISIDFSGLPSSCKILSTELVYCSYFSGCKSIEKLNILCRSTNFDSLKAFRKIPSNINLLKIDFSDISSFSIQSSELLSLVVFLLEKFKTLEVLSLGHVFISSPFGNYAKDILSTVLNKILEGDDDYHISWFSKNQLAFCRDNDNLKMFILGKTCFRKKTVDATLFIDIDKLDSKLPMNSVVLPLELLTD